MDQNMSRNASELRLLATFPEKDVTHHENASSDNGKKWKDKKFLGRGWNGEVSVQECIDECVDNGNISKLRAVKKLRDTSYKNIVCELEAIATFRSNR
jgi:hypothetical protein